MDDGQRVLEERHDVAAVAGRRRERHPEQTIYNRLADLEWDSPIGEAKYCGGDVLTRGDAFRQVGGYNPALIAGEEPDLCVRLRQHGWIILRIDAEMTLHDIAMTRFSQWWKRSERGGFAFAQGVAMHGRPPERHWVHELRSTILWGLDSAAFHSRPGVANTWREPGAGPGLPTPGVADHPAAPQARDAPPAMHGFGAGTAYSAAFPTPLGRCATGPAGSRVATKP